MTIRHGLAVLPFALIASTQAHAASITVRSGDSLSTLARAHLGSGARWPELCEANQDVLRGNCDDLLVGTTLVLPGTDTEEQKPVAAEPEAEVTVAEAHATNLLQSANDLTDNSQWRANGLTVSALGGGAFELVATGAADPGLSQNIATVPAGVSYRLTGEAKAGVTANATPIMRVFGYALAQDGSPEGTTITTGDEPLKSEFSPFEIVVKVPEGFTGKEAFVFRLDPGDGSTLR